MIVIVEQKDCDPPRYYKYTQGKPIFGAKRDAVVMDEELADMVLRQLHALNHADCRKWDKDLRFKRGA